MKDLFETVEIEKKQYKCECGKTQHDFDALYCTKCGKKIEETTAAVSSSKNHLDL